MQNLIVRMTVEEAEALATISEMHSTILDYERVLRKIERWNRDAEPSQWAKQILQANRRRLDS